MSPAHAAWKGRLFTALRLALGALLLALAVRQVDWGQLGPTLAAVRPAWLLLALGSVLVSLALRIWRWQRLLHNYQVPTAFADAAGAYLAGQAANIVMPVRGGEVVRFAWLRARQTQGAVPVVASIAIEKYLDLTMLLLFFVGVMPRLPSAVIEANLNLLVISSLLLTALVVIGAARGPQIGLWFSGLVQRRLGWAAPAAAPLARWLADSAWMQSPRRFLPALGLSLAAWLVMALTNLLVMLAVGLPVNFTAAALVLVLVYVGSVPALLPGNIGPFHFFAMLALSLAGIEGPMSAAFALYLHALVTLPPLLLSVAWVIFGGRPNVAQKPARKDVPHG